MVYAYSLVDVPFFWSFLGVFSSTSSPGSSDTMIFEDTSLPWSGPGKSETMHVYGSLLGEAWVVILLFFVWSAFSHVELAITSTSLELWRKCMVMSGKNWYIEHVMFKPCDFVRTSHVSSSICLLEFSWHLSMIGYVSSGTAVKSIKQNEI